MDRSRIARRGVLGAAGLLAAAPGWARAAAGKPRVVIRTPRGDIVVELETGRAPVTSGNFLRYVDAQKYDGGAFYRASRTKGAPAGSGKIQGGPSARTRRFTAIAHESTRTTGLRHKAGAISMGRNAPGTATADFFICASASPYLDAHPGAPGDNAGFAAFGMVVEGMDVVRAILAAPTGGPAASPQMKGEMLNPSIPILQMRRV